MDGTDHNKILGLLHTVYGILSVVTIGLISAFMLVAFIVAAISERDAMPLIVVVVVIAVILLLNIVFALPSFLAGYAMLKRKRWAKSACVAAAVIDGMSFPFGTALCVYTLWFMFSPQGKLLYDNVGQAKALPPSPPPWQSKSSEPQAEYIPPSAPPNWR